ncbi:hypothetical protein BDV28DRAFT_133292 [Aspergillus coremiiformis]|uniref:Uncharacterized protein n=1 Tax=Aspergillus coremiiformis TaxID=138285 RepID=A0A5N6ZBA5_9EURO|nr:hypothetical protein BDV28DRAFT_133292 [Aspergillus coremiiformis]
MEMQALSNCPTGVHGFNAPDWFTYVFVCFRAFVFFPLSSLFFFFLRLFGCSETRYILHNLGRVLWGAFTGQSDFTICFFFYPPGQGPDAYSQLRQYEARSRLGLEQFGF